MRATIILALSMVALASLVASGLACGAQPEEESLESSSEAPADPLQSDQSAPWMGKIYSAIEQEREKIRNAEGREGILAEERHYSVFDEELIIRDFFQDRRGGFFLDVGCAWPVRASNTYYLEKHLGWTGIGIDALAEYGPAWTAKRPNSRFFSYLVTDRSGVKEIFFKSPDSGLSSTQRDLASGEIFGLDLEPEKVEIHTITLDDLLDREGVTKIDLLAMDIEGHEPKALAGFDIERFRPELAVIERPLHPEEIEKSEVYRYFQRHGYQLIEKYRPFDTVNLYFERKTP
jgi:FkbM family methyltransferase